MPQILYLLDDGETYSSVAEVLLVTDETAAKLDNGEYNDPSDFELGDILMSQDLDGVLEKTVWDVTQSYSPKTTDEVDALLGDWFLNPKKTLEYN